MTRWGVLGARGERNWLFPVADGAEGFFKNGFQLLVVDVQVPGDHAGAAGGIV